MNFREARKSVYPDVSALLLGISTNENCVCVYIHIPTRIIDEKGRKRGAGFAIKINESDTRNVNGNTIGVEYVYVYILESVGIYPFEFPCCLEELVFRIINTVADEYKFYNICC